jgi:hypothetical protein
VYGVREKVGIDEDGVGRAKGSVGLEEERGGDLGAGVVLVASVERQ